MQAEECWNKSLAPLMAQVRERVGDTPVYLSFDIDGLDRSRRHRHAGNRRPHRAAGPRNRARMKGLNIVGADLVEVAPPYDPTGTTALTGANLAFEMFA